MIYKALDYRIFDYPVLEQSSNLQIFKKAFVRDFHKINRRMIKMHKIWLYCLFIVLIFLFILSLVTPVPFDEFLSFFVAIVAFVYIIKDVAGEIDRWLSSSSPL